MFSSGRVNIPALMIHVQLAHTAGSGPNPISIRNTQSDTTLMILQLVQQWFNTTHAVHQKSSSYLTWSKLRGTMFTKKWCTTSCALYILVYPTHLSLLVCTLTLLSCRHVQLPSICKDRISDNHLQYTIMTSSRLHMVVNCIMYNTPSTIIFTRMVGFK